MAKKAEVKKPGKEVAPVKPSSAPATQGRSKYAGKGQDSIEQDEILMPRMKLGQSMSPEVKDGIVEEGDIFNSVTGEVICKAGEALPVIVVAKSREYILWDDRKGDNRGMLARAQRVTDKDGNVRYKWNHPGETFEVKVDGKTKVKYKLGNFIDEDGLNEWGTQLPGNEESPPAANEHQNYILALPTRDMELIALSMSKTAIGAARKLNTSIKLAANKCAMFEMEFQLSSFIDSRGEDKFANFQIAPGWKRVDEETADILNDLFEGLKSKNIVVDQSQEDVVEGDGKKKGGASSDRRF